MTEENNTKEYTLPCEILEVIFSHVDHETLLECHLLCKNWKAQIQNRIWRIKAELTVHENFSNYHNVPWQVFYMICKKNRNPFEKNLLKNHSGENDLKYWTTDVPHRWTIENPPVNVPKLPVDEDPTFEGKQFCFATYLGTKNQTVNLVDEGFHSYILDTFQPPIEVSEWFCGSKNFIKELQCELLTDKNDILDSFIISAIEGKPNEWQRINHIMTVYKEGLSRIKFSHFGSSTGIIGKMAGACVKIKFPCYPVVKNDNPSNIQQK